MTKDGYFNYWYCRISNVDVSVEKQGDKYVAKVMQDPDYTKSVGNSLEEAIGMLLVVYPGFFSATIKGSYRE